MVSLLVRGVTGDYRRRRCSERDVSGDRRHRVSGSLHRSPRRGSRSPTLSWADCSDGFLCATAVVPLNYNRPSDEQIDLAAIKLPRDRPGQAIACNRESTAAYRNARLPYWSSETHSPTGRRVVGPYLPIGQPRGITAHGVTFTADPGPAAPAACSTAAW